MSTKKRNKKHIHTLVWVMYAVVWFILLVGLKILNQLILSTDEWNQLIKETIGSSNDAWFKGGINWATFLTGPIGFKSLVQFKVIFGTQVALPVLWDSILNWLMILGAIIFIIIIWRCISKEKKINKILSEEGTTTQGLDTELEVLEEEVVIEKVSPIKKESIIEEQKIVDVIEDPKPKVNPVKITAIKEKVVQEKRTTQIIKVNKKHYEQVSKKYLLEQLYAMHPGETKKAVKNTVEEAFLIIAECLVDKEVVIINGFGKFERADKEAREGINPLTGETIQIKAANSAKFKSAKNLKDKMTDTTWTGLYQIDKEIDVKEEKSQVENTLETQTLDANNVKADEATVFLKQLEVKYKTELNNSNEAENLDLSTAERSKIDGSDSIEETRSELQKHANTLRTVAVENNFRQSLKEINLRNMTKKELIIYMKKVRAEYNK